MERPIKAQDEITRRQHYLKGVIDRFESSVAVVRLDSGQAIDWPRTQLPPDAHEGSAIRLVLSTSASDEEERTRIAKALLNEILDTTK